MPNILTRLVASMGAKAVATPRALGWQIFSQPGSRIDWDAQAKGDSSSILIATINWIARTFPEAPPMVWSKTADGLEPLADHPLVSLLRRPNQFYSGSALWMATIYSWVMDGNAYWIKDRSSAGATVALWYAPHWAIEPKYPGGRTETYISHYEYVTAGIPERIDTENVVHFRAGLDPANVRKGLSPLKSLFREIWTDEEAANFSATLLRNSGVPGIVISPDGEMAVAPSPDEVKAAKAYYQQNTTGDRRGEPLVMTGPTKVQQFGFNPSQMNLRELRQIPEERITAVLGIPAAVVGLGTGMEQTKVGATLQELRELAYENNIIPTQRLFSEELTTQLAPEFLTNPTAFEVGFDLSNVRILQDDQNALADRWGKLVQSSIATRAEGREALGLEVEDVDRVYLVPMSVMEVPAGTLSTDMLSSGPQSPVDGPEGLRGYNDPSFGLKALKTPHSGTVAIKSTPQQTRLMRQFRRDSLRLESLFTGNLISAFEELGDLAGRVAADRIKSLVPGDGLKVDPEPEDILTADDIIAGMNLEQWAQDRLQPEFEGHYLRSVQLTVNSVETIMGLGVDLPDEVQRNVVRIGGRRAGMVDITEDTRRAIYNALADGRSVGEGPPDLVRRIRDLVPSGRFRNAGSGYRSRMIARTETKYAQNVSSIAAYSGNPAFTGVIAFDNQIGYDDADCIARDGNVYTLEEAARETELEHPNGTLSWAPNVRQLS